MQQIRAIIIAENVRREAEHLTQLNIDQMATLLTQRSADRIQSQEVIFKASESSLPNLTLPSAERVEMVGPPPPPAVRGRGQNRFRGGYNRGRAEETGDSPLMACISGSRPNKRV